jgi:DNA-binding protein HU-beta
MNHKELIDRLSQTAEGESKATIDRVVRRLVYVIAAELKNTGKFTLHGIGTLSVVETDARDGRNPQTGETIRIPARKRVKLSTCKALKEAVNQ